MTSAVLALEHARPLAPLTSLKLGGSAAQFVQADTRETLLAALALAQRESWPVGILGGGSNLIIGDEGFSGLVVHMATRGIELVRGPEYSRLTVQAGESWDQVVELAVREGLAGIECLTGIPGCTGATPIQNVGAYGQEVCDVIEAVELFDRADGTIAWWNADRCGFAYRDSRFKQERDRFVILAVRFVLRTDGEPVVRYGELTRELARETNVATLRDVQRVVRRLRASKGMLMDASFEPSAGSFFTNPIVPLSHAERIIERALQGGVITSAEQLPRYPGSEGSVKLSAGWLIEHAGICKGQRRGPVGVSTRHALALVHHGGGTTRELIALATQIQQQVDGVFGLQLQIEPVRW